MYVTIIKKNDEFGGRDNNIGVGERRGREE